MLNMASNTTVPYMNKTTCNSVPLIVPPINDQKRFGEIYEKAQAKLIKMEQSETKCAELCNSLSQKAFAGEL
jgi:type I restriction enzyme S subunit